MVAASILVAWGLRRYLRSSPRFDVRTLQVDGVVRRSPHHIAKIAGIGVGDNIFELNTAAAVTGIEQDPWIAAATVETDLPSTVRIQVTEREARALASLDGALYVVDTQGEIFKPFEEGDPHDLPIVTGLEPEALAADREASRRRVHAALGLLNLMAQAQLDERYPVQEIHVPPAGGVTLTVGRDAVSLVFGDPPYRHKVEKATRILGELRYQKVQPAVLFLDNRAHPERVVVRMR